jgi:hypothetical protein
LEFETRTNRAEPLPRESLPWWLATVGGALVSALAGWVLVTAFVIWAQVAATDQVTATGWRLGTQLWLLAQGGPAQIDGLTISLMPLLVTGVIVLLLHGVAGFAGRQAYLRELNRSQDRRLTDDQRRHITVTVSGLFAAVYTLTVVVVAIVIDPGGPALWAGLGAAALSLVTGFWGTRSASGWKPPWPGPVWLRAVPRAAATAVVIVLLTGVVACVVGLISHRQLVVAFFEQLQPGLSGVILLALLQVVYLPNFIVWAAAWSIGAGFHLGENSQVLLAGQSVDAVPLLPMIGALPAQTVATPLSLLWLIGGVVAGAAAAGMVLRARPRARFDETALVGGLSGVVAGVVFWFVGLLTRGDLGEDRLVGLGPLPLATLVLASTLLGFAGLLTGLVAGLLRSPGPADPAGASPASTGDTGDDWPSGDRPGRSTVAGAVQPTVGAVQPTDAPGTVAPSAVSADSPVDEATRQLRRQPPASPQTVGSAPTTILTQSAVVKPQFSVVEPGFNLAAKADQLGESSAAEVINADPSQNRPQIGETGPANQPTNDAEPVPEPGPTVAMGNPFTDGVNPANQPTLNFDQTPES